MAIPGKALTWRARATVALRAWAAICKTLSRRTRPTIRRAAAVRSTGGPRDTLRVGRAFTARRLVDAALGSAAVVAGILARRPRRAWRFFSANIAGAKRLWRWSGFDRASFHRPDVCGADFDRLRLCRGRRLLHDRRARGRCFHRR